MRGADRAIKVLEGGNEAMILNEDDLPKANIDMEGPSTSPYFRPNPNHRQDGWVNATVDFGGEYDMSKNENGWLIYNDDDADDSGVGGYMPVLRYAEEDDESVEDAIAAEPLSLTNFPGESKKDGYCVVVSAVDALGNESDLPDEDDGMCVMAGVPDANADNDTNDATGYEMLLEDLRLAETATPVDENAVTDAKEALANAGLLAGLDITPPGIEIAEDMRVNLAANLSFDFDIYDDLHEDHNSGLHTQAPLLVRIQRRTTDDTECLDIGNAADVVAGTGVLGEVENGDDESCTANPTGLPARTPITFGSTAPDTALHAYYTLTGSAVDQAGNFAMPVSHTFAFDQAPATATPPAAPGSLEAGESFEIASFLNDDLSIRDYYVTANFPTVGGVTGEISLGIVAPTMVDAFNADMLTHRNFSVTTDVDTYAGLQGGTGAGTDDDPLVPTAEVMELATVGVAVRDQTDSDGTDDATNSASLMVAAADDDGFAVGDFTVEFTTSDDALCAAEDTDDCAEAVEDETETELEVVATQTGTGTFRNPFERVDFWVRDVNGAHWMLGSDTSGERDSTGTGDSRRLTWTYSLDATAMAIHMRTREADFPPAGETDSDTGHIVLAFAVNDDGVALVMEVTITIDDGDDEN